MKEKQPLRILELFGGIGAFSAALDRLAIPYTITDYVEIDKYAVQSYNAIHGTQFEPQDITQWDKDVDVDFIMHGSPCFTADTLILTQEGYKKIVDIREGDLVLDKNHTYQKVERWIPQGKKEIWNLSCMGTDGIQTTENHRFLARKKEKKWNNQLRKYQTIFHDSEWIECKDLTKQYLLGYAINQESKIPTWDELGLFKDLNKYGDLSKPKLDLNSRNFWYLVGCFCSNGQPDFNYSQHNRVDGHPCGVRIHIHKENAPKAFEIIQDIFTPNYIGKTTHNDLILTFYQKDLCDFLLLPLFQNTSGNYSHTGDELPSLIFDLPESLLAAFLEGYFDARCSIKNSEITYPTASLKVLYGLGQCIAKAFHKGFSVSKRKSKNQDNQFPVYTLHFSTHSKSRAVFKDDFLWFPVKSVENTHEWEEVYDLTVANSHSFTANGIIAHNCQDFSIAGLQAGGDKDSGTRSSLMYETVRIVQKLKPKYVLWENVANMLSDKHRHNFDAYWEAMESFGYHNASYTLNAKDYGIPQNRVRIFTLSVLNEFWKPEYFIPPKGKKLEKCLADILEQNVEEKYYLSDKLVQSLLKHKEKHKAAGHGFGCEIKDVYQDVANPIICGGQGLEKNLIPNEVSPTISARYFKDGSDCLLRVHQIGNLFQYKRENPSAGRVYDKNGLSPTLTNMQGGHRQPYIVEADGVYSNPMIAAMRGRYVEPVIGRSVGRNPDDPSRRVAGDPTEQRLEINAKGLCNTLTSVQKDNLVVEPKMTSGSDIAGCIRSSIYKQGSRNLIENILHKRGYEGVLEPVGLPVVNATKQGYEMAYPGDSVNLNYPDSKTRRGRVGKGCAQTLTCSDSMGVVVDNISLYDTQYRIRKLTPRECWRLMGFQDEEFEKAQAVCSNTQLYKQAGNSIVVDVLVALLKEIFSYELKGKLETF